MKILKKRVRIWVRGKNIKLEVLSKKLRLGREGQGGKEDGRKGFDTPMMKKDG